MKKYFPVILLLATVMLSACGKKTEQIGNSATPTETTKTENKVEKSIKELLGMGISQKCSYEINEDGQKMKGEILVGNGGKFKQITEVSEEKGTMKINVISDGTYVYYWNEAMKGVGSKMKIDSVEQVKVTGTPEEEKVDMNKKINYSCNPINLSESDFALPSGIKFVDLSETMKNLQEGNYDQLKDLIPNQGDGE